MLNIAYIGFGKSTNRYHLPYLKLRQDKFNIARVVTPTLGKRAEEQAALEAEGTIFSTEIDDIIQDQTIDLVVVVTPSDKHYQITKQLLLAGKNVMVDKPMATSEIEARDLVNLAYDKGLFLMPFQSRRFDSDFLTVQRVIKNGYLGRLVDLEVHMDHYRPNDGKELGTSVEGSLFDHGVHLVDQIISLFGMPNIATYDLRATRILNSPVDDQMEINLFYPKAFKATLQTTELAAIQYPKWQLRGTHGTFVKYEVDEQENDLKTGIMPGEARFGVDTPQHYGHLVYYNQSGDRIEKFIPSIQGDYGRVYDSVYNTLVKGTPKLVSDEQMLSVMKILSAGVKENGPHVIKF
ncbi:oxidoreductase [Leuconostoc litchii]|uniref:Oxidoreductase n=1 Tax=Leuconostoc litchii TaxID=1981069 RepID=A0A6P2CNE7_9LACO|nr:Gfo/Idh/MocA family oxidoreductase [Leuconostoc litchii]TYC46913.1 oxidoreductase [Leuconostoc litchii]GMA68816.1 oxidoreductase [Leuconostoc litchii]